MTPRSSPGPGRRLPDFIIAGAPKSGTTSLWHHLDMHPGVFMSRLKEPNFFSNLKGIDAGGADSTWSTSGNFAKGLDWYASLFEGAQPDQIIGEASTIYFYSPDSPGLIHEHMPGAKIVFILRHPADRLCSHYYQECRHGWGYPPLPDMIAQSHPRYQLFHAVSSYRKTLQRYYAVMPAEQIHILIFEELRTNPADTLRRLFQWLEIEDDGRVTVDRVAKRNAARRPRIPVLQRLATTARRSRIVRRMPDSVRRIGSPALRILDGVNLKESRYEPLDADIRSALSEQFREDIEYVEKRLDRDIGAWHEKNRQEQP